jgi:hypothetical protein
MLIDGKWTADWHPVQSTDEKGDSFARPQVSAIG